MTLFHSFEHFTQTLHTHTLSTLYSQNPPFMTTPTKTSNIPTMAGSSTEMADADSVLLWRTEEQFLAAEMKTEKREKLGSTKMLKKKTKTKPQKGFHTVNDVTVSVATTGGEKKEREKTNKNKLGPTKTNPGHWHESLTWLWCNHFTTQLPDKWAYITLPLLDRETHSFASTILSITTLISKKKSVIVTYYPCVERNLHTKFHLNRFTGLSAKS